MAGLPVDPAKSTISAFTRTPAGSLPKLTDSVVAATAVNWVFPDGDPMAVVDQHCRVRGVEGLRVVDLSVAPNVVRANTNATAIMIAERASVWF